MDSVDVLSKQVRRSCLGICIAIPMLYYFSVAIAWVSIVLIVVSLGGGVREYAFVNLIFNATSALFSYILPRFIAGRERRSILALSYGLLAIVYLTIYASRSLIHIYIANVLYGLAAALILSIQTPVFIELFGRGRGIPLMYIATSSGWIISLALGGTLRSFLTVRELMLLPFLGSIACSILSMMIPRTVGVVEAQKMIAFRRLFLIVVERIKRIHFLAPTPRLPSLKPKLRPIEVYLLASALIFVAISLYFSALPVYLKSVIGLRDEDLFYCSMFSGIASLAVYLFQLKIGDRIEILLKLHISALAIRSILFSLPIVLSERIHYYVLYLFIGASWGFIGSVQSHIIAYLAEPHRKDERFGHLNTSISVGLIVGNIIAMVMSCLGYTAMFVLSSVLIACAAVFIWTRCRIY